MVSVEGAGVGGVGAVDGGVRARRELDSACAREEELGEAGGDGAGGLGVEEVDLVILAESVLVVARLRVDAPRAGEMIEEVVGVGVSRLPPKDDGVRALEGVAEGDDVAVDGGGAAVALCRTGWVRREALELVERVRLAVCVLFAAFFLL